MKQGVIASLLLLTAISTNAHATAEGGFGSSINVETNSGLGNDIVDIFDNSNSKSVSFTQDGAYVKADFSKTPTPTITHTISIAGAKSEINKAQAFTQGHYYFSVNSPDNWSGDTWVPVTVSGYLKADINYHSSEIGNQIVLGMGAYLSATGYDGVDYWGDNNIVADGILFGKAANTSPDGLSDPRLFFSAVNPTEEWLNFGIAGVGDEVRIDSDSFQGTGYRRFESTFLTKVGYDVDIYMSLDTRGGVEDANDTLSVKAILDPYITFGKGYENLGLTITTSTGYGNTPVAAVPEPESYAMLMAGIGLMGFVARRRNRKI